MDKAEFFILTQQGGGDLLEETEFLILLQQGSGIVIKCKGEFYIAQYWLLSTSNRLEDWDFQGAPDIEGMFVVSAEINYDRGGDIEIRHEKWRLANITDIRSFDIKIAE